MAKQKIKTFKDNDGQVLLPRTHEDAVITKDGRTIEQKYATKDALDNATTKVTETIESLKGTGDLPAATVAEVALQGQKLSELGGKVGLQSYIGEGFRYDAAIAPNKVDAVKVGYLVTPYIPVSFQDTVVWKTSELDNATYLALYGDNYEYLDAWSANAETRSINISNRSAKFIRATFKAGAGGAVSINGIEVFANRSREDLIVSYGLLGYLGVTGAVADVNALKREMSVLDISNEVCDSSIGTDEKYVRYSDSTIQGYSGAQYFITNKIHIRKSEALLISGRFANSFAIVAVANSDGTYSAKMQGSASVSNYVYIADEEHDIVVSAYKDTQLVIEKYSSSVLSAIETKVKKLDGIEGQVIDIELDGDVKKADKYIKADGTIASSYSAWAYAEIPLHCGDKIEVKTAAIQSQCAMGVMRYNGFFQVISTGEGTSATSAPLKVHDFTAEEDCVVGVSWATARPHTAKVYRYNILDTATRGYEPIEAKCKRLSRSIFDASILNVAYSTIRIAPINSEEHFLIAIHLGFNALKADIAITSDNELICWHGSYFKFDENGRILDSESEGTLVHNVTYAVAKEYEHSFSTGVGYHAHICTIDRFLFLCKKYGVVPYITVRNDSDNYPMSIVLAKLKGLLDKYNLEDKCVINIYPFSKSKAETIREYLPNAYLCCTIGYNTTLAKEHIEFADYLGNACVCIDPTTIPTSSAVFGYAKELNIRVMAHDVGDITRYNELVEMGLIGFQTTAPIFSYVQKVICFGVFYSDGNFSIKAAIGEIDTLSADITHDASARKIYISNLKEIGNNGYVVDGLPPLWMNVLPYSLREYRRGSVAEWKDNKIVITYNGTLENNTTFGVCVEV